MDNTVSISKDAAVQALLKAGYESYLEDGVVFVKWNDDPKLPDTIKDFLHSHGYLASYGIKERANGTSTVPAEEDVVDVDDGAGADQETDAGQNKKIVSEDEKEAAVREKTLSDPSYDPFEDF